VFPLLPDVVLISPVIAQNTGTIARTCAGLGVRLHVVFPCAFSFESRYLKRAGLDYWDVAKLCIHSHWQAFMDEQGAQLNQLCFLTTKTQRLLSGIDGETREQLRYLVFGSETGGFPPDFYERYKHKLVTLPQNHEAIRSYNLSVAVGMALGVLMNPVTEPRTGIDGRVRFRD
jgi:tRNA (cytidine/uridine-2'-O-)-methyltransferase